MQFIQKQMDYLFEELNSGTTKDIKKIDNVVEVNNRVQFTNKSERDSLNLYLDLLRKKF